ncbi:nucleotidyltransferase domain-containing protein [Nanoarchaeota archaeon]
MIKKSIKDKIKEYFFLNPTIRLRVRQIEREVKVPLPSVIRYTKELEEEKTLKSSTIADVKMYSADRTSEHFLLEKKLFNIRQLFSSGLIASLVEKLSNPTLVVFGSYSRGEDIEKSDIDIYIGTPSKKKVNLGAFEKILQRNIQVFIHSNIHNIKNKELANNIVNGITLNGFVEVFR